MKSYKEKIIDYVLKNSDRIEVLPFKTFKLDNFEFGFDHGMPYVLFNDIHIGSLLKDEVELRNTLILLFDFVENKDTAVMQKLYSLLN